jgi:hypothetical protein
MTATSGKRAGAGVALVAAIAACTTTPIALDEPKAVSAMPLTPYELRDECVRLAEGDRLEYTFDATEPVAFEIRYREGVAIIAPLVRDPSRGDAGVFLARLPRVYCLAWEAGAAGALVDYRLRLRPAVR